MPLPTMPVLLLLLLLLLMLLLLLLLPPPPPLLLLLPPPLHDCFKALRRHPGSCGVRVAQRLPPEPCVSTSVYIGG